MQLLFLASKMNDFLHTQAVELAINPVPFPFATERFAHGKHLPFMSIIDLGGHRQALDAGVHT